MRPVTFIRASTSLDFEHILRLFSDAHVLPAAMYKYRIVRVIPVFAPIEVVDKILNTFLGSIEYPYTNYQLQTREARDNGIQVQQL